MKLKDIAINLSRKTFTSKGPDLYDAYEPYLSPLAEKPVRMIELGVHAGDSLRVFSTYFRNGLVVGVDLAAPDADLSSYENAVFELGDQREGDELRAFSERYAPGGWDIILDDASHYGSWSRLTFDALYPRLKGGGLYIVEDWYSGYWDDWPDGQRYQRTAVDVLPGHIPPRIISHDSGMVGFVKSLVDELVDRPVGNRDSHIGYPRTFEWMHILKHAAILKKVLS